MYQKKKKRSEDIHPLRCAWMIYIKHYSSENSVAIMPLLLSPI
jgi:hypothetical protein